MKSPKPTKVNEIIAATRGLLTGEVSRQAKEAREAPPAFTTPEGDALRAHAAKLRSFDFSTEKRAGILRVINGDMPSQAQIVNAQEKKAGLDLRIDSGDSPAETLRNVAGTLRTFGEQVKTAAHVEGFKTVRAHVAAERLFRHLNA